MANIGGNITAAMQIKSTEGKNALGEANVKWQEAFTLVGWLDLQSGGMSRTTFNAKIEESTHIFLCDYNSDVYAFADKDTRLIIKGNMYDVLLIDNPNEMNEQLEIYLKKVGGQNG
jgi:SPP1 family predicted phage head-tail adaptor